VLPDNLIGIYWFRVFPRIILGHFRAAGRDDLGKRWITETQNGQMQNQMTKMITTDEAAQLLKVTAVRVRQLIASGALESEKRGRDHLLTEEAVTHYDKHSRRKTGRPRKKYLRTR